MNPDENHTSRKPKWCKVIKHPGIKYVIKAVINGLIMLFTVSLIHFLVNKSCNTFIYKKWSQLLYFGIIFLEKRRGTKIV